MVRIVGSDKQDIVSRLAGNYTSLGLVQTMDQALDRSGRVTPPYLQLLEEELRAKVLGTETAVLSMFCFWTGEGHYGNLPGVVATEPGFMNGREVVKVEYSPEVISFEKLIQSGSKVKCADQLYAEDDQQKEAAKKVLGLQPGGRSIEFPPRRRTKILFVQNFLPLRAHDLSAGSPGKCDDR